MVYVCVLSHFSPVRLCVTLWTTACQAPLSMGFSRQEYWSGLPFLPPGDLPNPGIESAFLVSPMLAGEFFTTSAAWKAQTQLLYLKGKNLTIEFIIQRTQLDETKARHSFRPCSCLVLSLSPSCVILCSVVFSFV